MAERIGLVRTTAPPTIHSSTAASGLSKLTLLREYSMLRTSRCRLSRNPSSTRCTSRTAAVTSESATRAALCHRSVALYRAEDDAPVDAGAPASTAGARWPLSKPSLLAMVGTRTHESKRRMIKVGGMVNQGTARQCRFNGRVGAVLLGQRQIVAT